LSIAPAESQASQLIAATEVGTDEQRDKRQEDPWLPTAKNAAVNSVQP